MSDIGGRGLIGIELIPVDTPDDPIMITTAVLDHPVVVGPVDLHRREDLELWSALHALAYYGVGRHPLGVVTGDKPDRMLTLGDRSWGTELTQLTIGDIASAVRPTPREQMAQAHRFRDRLQARIESIGSSYPHLEGQAVTIQKLFRQTLPKKDEALLNQIAEALKEDKGFLFEGPGHARSDRGQYGNFGPFDVTVQAIPDLEGINIFVACDFEVRQSEAIAALAKRVAAKDVPGNDILIVTCCVPDPQGWASATDHSIFHHLRSAQDSGLLILQEKPAHIRGILIHESPDAPGLILLNDSQDVPWLGASSRPTAPPNPQFRRPGVTQDR